MSAWIGRISNIILIPAKWQMLGTLSILRRELILSTSIKDTSTRLYLTVCTRSFLRFVVRKTLKISRKDASCPH